MEFSINLKLRKLGKLSKETMEYIYEAVSKGVLSLAAVTSLIYLHGFEEGKGIRYWEMRKYVLKEMDRAGKTIEREK